MLRLISRAKNRVYYILKSREIRMMQYTNAVQKRNFGLRVFGVINVNHAGVEPYYEVEQSCKVLIFDFWYGIKPYFLISATKKGFSNKEIEKQLGLKSYESFWGNDT